MQRRVLVRDPGSGRFPPRPRRSRHRRRSDSRAPANRDRADARVRGAAAADDRSRRATRRAARAAPARPRHARRADRAAARGGAGRAGAAHARRARGAAGARRPASRRPRAHGRRPFQLRPGLVAAMLDFYDELRRRQRTVRRFARALFDQLRVERGTDRGSEGLIHQTGFLGFAFLAYERGVVASGGMRRARALRGACSRCSRRCRSTTSSSPSPIIRPIRAASGRPTSICSAGWPGVARLDVVVTDETHDAGFRERIERELPGIEEESCAGRARPRRRCSSGRADRETDACFVSRDREEELRDVARDIRRRLTRRPRPRGRVAIAVVFHRPLPYLYLAQQVLADARRAVSGVRRAAARRRAVRGAARSRAGVRAHRRHARGRGRAAAIAPAAVRRRRRAGRPARCRGARRRPRRAARDRRGGHVSRRGDGVLRHARPRAIDSSASGRRARRAARPWSRDRLQPFRAADRASAQVGAIAAIPARVRPRRRQPTMPGAIAICARARPCSACSTVSRTRSPA